MTSAAIHGANYRGIARELGSRCQCADPIHGPRAVLIRGWPSDEVPQVRWLRWHQGHQGHQEPRGAPATASLAEGLSEV